MQKVVTIYSLGILSSANYGTDLAETLYPELQKLLDEGYRVKQVLSQQTGEYTTAITLLLEI